MTNSSHWFDVISSKSILGLPGSTKAKWKILREGAHWESFPVTQSCSASWKTIQSLGTVDSGAIKCVLQSTQSSDRCEMVTLFPKGRRATVCVSSQIGCGVGCIFCATGKMGLQRNLSCLEIVEQVYLARAIATQSGRHLRNVVFMGMGEPLHNLDNVVNAVRWIVSEQGFGIAQRFVTISTSGGNTSILALARQFPSVRLAISLHAANQDLRRYLMPKAPNDLEALRKTIGEINRLQPNTPVWLEVTMLAEINDSEWHASQLIEFCCGLRVEVNLIPYNPIQSDLCLKSANDQVHKRFANRLRSAGIQTTIRQSLGASDQAACGQLVVMNG